jgi:hypothetical protein
MPEKTTKLHQISNLYSDFVFTQNRLFVATKVGCSMIKEVLHKWEVSEIN